MKKPSNPKCTHCRIIASSVTDSRPTEGGYIQRRRKCVACGNRFSTIELSFDELALFINGEIAKKIADVQNAIKHTSIDISSFKAVQKHVGKALYKKNRYLYLLTSHEEI